jgi:hypothetical protein
VAHKSGRVIGVGKHHVHEQIKESSRPFGLREKRIQECLFLNHAVLARRLKTMTYRRHHASLSLSQNVDKHTTTVAGEVIAIGFDQPIVPWRNHVRFRGISRRRDSHLARLSPGHFGKNGMKEYHRHDIGLALANPFHLVWIIPT